MNLELTTAWYWALDNGVRLHYASPGDENENAFIESFKGRLRDECLNMYWFPNLKDAQDIVEDRRIDYNCAVRE